MALPEIATFQDLYALAKQAALLRTDKLTDKSFSAGFMADMLVGAACLIGEEAERIALELHRRTFFRTASVDDLDTLADDHFALARQAGVSAIGTVTFSRASTVNGNVLIPAGTRLSTPDGTLFQTTSDLLLTGLSLAQAISAVEMGEAGNVAAASITVILDPLTDSTVTVSNAEQTSGGLDAETDERFRARIRGYLATVRRGTADAIVFGAKTIQGVVSATVDETTDPPTLYIADVTGGANTALVAAVQDGIIAYRAAGIPVNVVGATVVQQAISLHLTFAAGSDTQATRDLVVSAVEGYVNGLDIGETLYESQVVAAASVAGIVNVTVVSPAGDVAPTKDQLLRTSADQIALV